MKKYFIGYMIFILLCGVFGPIQTVADSTQAQCKAFNFNDGYFFDNYEKVEYVNHLLVMHFQLKNGYNDGRGWIDRIYLHRPDCTAEMIANPNTDLHVTAKMRSFSVRFASPVHYDLWNDETDLKIDCPACSVDIPPKLSNGSDYIQISYAAIIDNYASFMHSGSYPVTDGIVSVREPVLIIPGLLGTELNKNDQKIWPNPSEMVLDRDNSFMDVLAQDELGRSKDLDVHPGDVISSISYVFGKYHYSDLLIDEFTNQGYQMGKDLFLMPYDWRLNADAQTGKLNDTITEILKNTGANKIDIIAHSFGGLVLKRFLSQQNQLDDKIDSVIFVGVPNLGSSESAEALVFGDDLNMPLLNPDKVRDLAQNMPSIYETLPSKEYFNHISGFYDDLTNNYLQAILNYDQSKQLLLSLNKNPRLLAEAEGLHQSLDDLDLSAKNYQVFNIVGCGTFTTKTITKMFNGSGSAADLLLHQPKYRIVPDTGDGTVLASSAEYLKTPAGHVFYAKNVEHSEMLSVDGIRDLIVSIIGGQPKLAENISTTADDCGINGQLLSFSNNFDFSVKTLSGDQAKVIQKKVVNDRFVFVPANGSKYQFVLTAKDTTKSNTLNVAVTNYKKTEQNTFYYNKLVLNNNRMNLALDGQNTQAELDGTDGSIQNLTPSADPPVDPADSVTNQAGAPVPSAPQVSQPQIFVVSPQAPAQNSPDANSVGTNNAADATNNISEDALSSSEQDSTLAQNPESTAGKTNILNVTPPMPIYITVNIPEPKAQKIEVPSQQNSIAPAMPKPEVIYIEKPPNIWQWFKRSYQLIKLPLNLIFF